MAIEYLGRRKPAKKAITNWTITVLVLPYSEHSRAMQPEGHWPRVERAAYWQGR